MTNVIRVINEMSTFSVLRRAGFWSTDLLQGRHVARHLSDLERCLSNPSVVGPLSDSRLAALLNHAAKTTPFYSKFKSASDLSEFPVIQKEIVKRNFEEFFSSSYSFRSLKPVNTSGSYGTPFTFYLNGQKRARRTAEVIFFSHWAGYRIGTKHAKVTCLKQKSRLKLWLQNELLFDPTILDLQCLERLRRFVLNSAARIVIGNPSTFEALAEYCRTKGDIPDMYAIDGIITEGEILPDTSHEMMESVFGCTVLARYSLNELGVVAHQCPQARKYHLNPASYVVEILSMDKDNPATEGEVGRIVVTDLFSHAMPLIRYDTGDLGAWGESCSCGLDTPMLRAIEGRAVEPVYNTEGVKILPMAVNNLMRDIAHVIQFRFIQKGKGDYTMSLLTMPAFAQEQVIRDRLKRILGKDANVRFEYVDSIPPLKSGKRPYVINEYRYS